MIESKLLESMEVFYSALADKTRLRLLNLIRDDEVCVCFFVEALKESQPKISRHLAYLRKAGIVAARKEGKWVHYKIVQPDTPHLREVLAATLNLLETQSDMQRDHRRLVKACLSSESPVTISNAPKPDTFAQPDIKQEAHAKPEELETFLL